MGAHRTFAVNAVGWMDGWRMDAGKAQVGVAMASELAGLFKYAS